MVDSAFSVTVDLVVLTVAGGELRLLLIERGIEPFRGAFALPGGFVLAHEDLDAAAARELREETGLRGHLEQLATFGAPRRDPRGRVVTVAYLALLPNPSRLIAGSDAAAAAWHAAGKLPRRLAFDHSRIIAAGLERARSKLEYTSLAAEFCPPEFTIAQLREVYEAVWQTELDPRNFHRKVTSAEGFVEATGEMTTGERGRPAALFHRGPAELLHPPLLRPR
jgi:8-oxo-dGTP diphosphatase